MKKSRHRSIDKRLVEIYELIGRVGSQQSISLSLSSLSNVIYAKQQHLDSLEQIRFDAIAVTITVVSLLVTALYYKSNISGKSFIELIPITLFILAILFTGLIIYYTCEINIEKKILKEKEQKIEDSKNKIVESYKKYTDGLEKWKNKEV